MVKVCINPHCEEVAHNTEKNETRCRNCDMILIKISKDQYLKKYIHNFFQVDYSTGNLVTPKELGFDIQLKIEL